MQDREGVIERIRNKRNGIIRTFLNESYLVDYISIHYPEKRISLLQIQLIMRDLMETIIEPVDANHYKTIIDREESSDRVIDTGGNDKLFLIEITEIIEMRIF